MKGPAVADERFSTTGFLKTYAFPVLFILLVPGIGFWFSGHAISRLDASFRGAILDQITHADQISAEQMQQATAFWTSTPVSAVCRSNSPETQQLVNALADACSQLSPYAWIRRLSVASMLVGLLAFLFASLCVACSLASQRALHYAFVAGWHVLKIAALLQAVFQGIVAVMLSYWMTVFWTERFWPKLVLMMGLGAACVVWLMIKAIFTRPATGFGVDGTLLTEQTAPRFWAHVREMAARVGTEPPTHIIAGIDDNFFVTENPVILGETRIEGRTLFVSFSLLKFLEKEEANAILAHELAHFSGNDTAYSKKMAPAITGYLQYLRALGAGGAFSLPLFLFMRLFWVLFQLSLSRMSRQREFRADAISAEITSPAHTGRALLKVVAYASYRRQVEQALFDQNRQHEELGIAGRVATGFGAYATSSRLLGELSEASYPHPLDDHPRLDARLAAVRAPIVPSHYARMLTAPVSESWLNDIAGATELEQTMWSAYEQRFADAHQEALAWRYLPATDEEREHVEKFFPKWQIATKKGDATLHGDIDSIRFSEWPAGRISYADIKECKIRESLGRKFLTIKVSTPADKVEIPLHRFASQPELLGVFERYMARHRTAMEHQQQSRDSSAA